MKEQAFNLYFQSGLTQQQIASMLGINRKTLYTWIQQGSWKRARHTARHAPTLLVQQYYDQLVGLNAHIAARTDYPFPTSAEADVMRKLSMVIKQVRTSWTPIDMIDIFTLFTNDLVSKGKGAEAISIVPLFDTFINENVEGSKNFDPMTRYYNNITEDEEYNQWLADQQEPPDPEPTTNDTPDPTTPTTPHNGATMGRPDAAHNPPTSLTSNNLNQKAQPESPTDNVQNGASTTTSSPSAPQQPSFTEPSNGITPPTPHNGVTMGRPDSAHIPPTSLTSNDLNQKSYPESPTNYVQNGASAAPSSPSARQQPPCSTPSIGSCAPSCPVWYNGVQVGCAMRHHSDLSS